MTQNHISLSSYSYNSDIFNIDNNFFLNQVFVTLTAVAVNGSSVTY